MKQKKIILALLVMIIAGSGCATRRQVQELGLEVQTIKNDVSEIKYQNAKLDTLFRSSMDQSRKLNADFSAYISTLEEQMQMIEARLQDAITLINRASGAIESRNPVTSQQNTGADSTQTDSTKVSGGQLDCQKVYNTAYYDFVRENYDMASQGFQNYIKSCPGTALADNAQYWIGECNYQQKKYNLSQQAFEKMITDYPKSEKLGSAKLKLGKSLYNQRFTTKAKVYFLDVIENHPGTEEAYEASQMLQRYN
jgi:tol-pal system protein YbgF